MAIEEFNVLEILLNMTTKKEGNRKPTRWV
jgi:hypothetical protein